MGPPLCVLLKSKVLFQYDPDVFRGGAVERGGESIGGGSGRTRGIRTPRETANGILPYLRAMKPDANFANPPELSSLRILRPTESTPQCYRAILSSGHIASADKNLIALYPGAYRPGIQVKGCYLIYDATKNSLSAIPQRPDDTGFLAGAGLGAVVLRCDGGEEGAYVLGELAQVQGSDCSEAALYTWRSSTAEWVTKVGRLPPEVCTRDRLFLSDSCFSFGGSILCWVDMFKGMLICDLRAVLEYGSDLEFRFIPLPEDSLPFPHRNRFECPRRLEVFCSIGCVRGAVKFVTMDGYGERPSNEVTLTIWTLLPDIYKWKKGRVYHLRDIWENETYQTMGLPQVVPSYPLLSMHEDDVVYLAFPNVTSVDGYESDFLLRIDMLHDKVQCHQGTSDKIPARLIAVECSAYLQDLEDHQRKAKARKIWASGESMTL
ncbi:uncharacterized protein LOC100824156 [Brachypodium distachyon]|uniref:DUF1618 domain-containing protein n=1 Tax=Brachypodium distachyon TaxID=15368 RepID=I1H869_BRADI|nr:uncharacterized protein LOC100824156 [Brachypodium distachyon]KQK22941.1 hypothetical protein BRADI_1g70240v3 [Brachypodium distachyon]|eukprot:XP_003561903.1 uncharacterized protein LOC100824156 [Brachypodium distachyon]